MSRSSFVGSHPATPPAESGELGRAYRNRRPDVDDPAQLVSLGAAGHGGSPTAGTFTEAHVRALTQAVCDYRRRVGVVGPAFVGQSGGPLCGPAWRTALGVLAANGLRAVVPTGGGLVPPPVVSWAIVAHNRGGADRLADGVALVPGLESEATGGFRYYPPHGGVAGREVSRWVEERANEYLLRDNAGVPSAPPDVAAADEDDLLPRYVADLRNVADVDAVRAAGVVLGVGPGSAGAAGCWDAIGRAHGLTVAAGDRAAGPGPRLQVAVDADGGGVRFGAPRGEFLAADEILAAAVAYLLRHRPGWPARSAVGMSVVGSRAIERAAAAAGRSAAEYPPGFRWFADGLYAGALGFAGEGSRATFLRFDGGPWTTDADGFALALLVAEVTARTGKELAELCRAVAAEAGPADRARTDLPLTAVQRARLRNVAPGAVAAALAGEPVTAVLTRAPGNDTPFDGVKVVAAGGWFAAIAAEADDACTVYAESVRGPAHLGRIVDDARRAVTTLPGYGQEGGR